jgi:polar amino acid transport system permease protein
MLTYQWDFSFLPAYKNALLQGLMNTAQLSLVIIFCGMLLGCALALMRLSEARPLRLVGSVYVELFRNVPALVMLFWFFYTIPVLTGIQNDRFLTAAVAFSLYTAAYFCEIFRSGIQSISKGQWEAGFALGMDKRDIFLSLILPQTLKRVLPALTNEVIEVVKISAVAATIAYPDLLYQAKLMSETEYRPVEAYTAVAGILIGFILILSGISYLLERRYQRSD